MKIKTLLAWILIFLFIGGTLYLTKRTLFKPKKITWYTLAKPKYRNILQVIRATGELEAEDTLKIGSIVPGVIEKMLKEENDQVKKGDLIATIDDGIGDTDVRETAGLLEQAKAQLEYITSFYQRQKSLYEAEQLSQDGFEKITRDYKEILAQVQQRQAQHDKAKMIFNNKKIRAPENGIILDKVSTEGETVTLASPATIIYTIAKDIKKMKVKLEIDENAIGNLKVDQKVYLTFDTYPHKRFIGHIKKISNAPIIKKNAVSYEATFILDNSEHLLRPGMSLNARILVGEKENVLSVPGYAFSINPQILAFIAKKHGFTIEPVDRKTREELLEKGNFNTLWIKKDKKLIEKGVELGINNNAFFEIVSGLSENDNVIIDIHEPDSMEQLYSKMFGKGL